MHPRAEWIFHEKMEHIKIQLPASRKQIDKQKNIKVRRDYWKPALFMPNSQKTLRPVHDVDAQMFHMFVIFTYLLTTTCL